MARGEPSGDAIAASVVRVGELPGVPGMGHGGGDCGPGMGEGGRDQAPRGSTQQQPEDSDGTSNQTTSTGPGTV